MTEPDLRERLRALRVDPADGGFSTSLHRRLTAAGIPTKPAWWRQSWRLLTERRIVWPALGATVAVATFLLLTVLRPAPSRPSAPESVASATRVPTSKVAVVRVNLSADVPVETAHIRVSLPEGLVFWTDGAELPQRSFEWTQPLRSGDNDIPIAVRGLRPGRYTMTVTAQIGTERIEDEVVLDVVDA
jgi:hypothetical protein